tara:strand:- start:470 stop:667 length:198 start_codon:yes stop_codon:yes gene_type:complete
MNDTTKEIKYPVSKTFKIKGIDITISMLRENDNVTLIIPAPKKQAIQIYNYIQEEGMDTLNFILQ